MSTIPSCPLLKIQNASYLFDLKVLTMVTPSRICLKIFVYKMNLLTVQVCLMLKNENFPFKFEDAGCQKRALNIKFCTNLV